MIRHSIMNRFPGGSMKRVLASFALAIVTTLGAVLAQTTLVADVRAAIRTDQGHSRAVERR
jgi:hypothetical protein